MVGGILSAGLLAAGLVMDARGKSFYDAHPFLTSIPKYKVTIVSSRLGIGAIHELSQLHIVPPLVLFLAKQPVVDKFDLSSVQ